MGTVYLGRDPDLDRNVAIKVLRDPLVEDELLQRFFREAKATASLRHENLVTVYQVGEHDHQPFIAMEYVDGTTLAEIIKQKQPRPVAQKLVFIEQICAGLHHAHRSGIVHRDIKPANVMVDSQGIIRILDFGIARVANSGMTTDGALIGSLNYMSPEQMIGKPVDFRSDIFSVGSLAYELLTYHQAFPGTMNDGLLHRLPQEDPAPFDDVSPGIPKDLEAIVFRALSKRPDDRFASLDEMRTAIRNARRGVNPQLQLETVVIPAHNRPKPPARPVPSSASSEERRGLLERRARQIAVHRDAARAALTRGDVDAAVAACEDALTLDPDDAEASQLLVEIRQQKERRDEESKARRDRERTMRQRVADAELALQHGDVASAARQLEQVLREEPNQPTALTLLDKVQEAATHEGLVLPDALKTYIGRKPVGAPTESKVAPGPTEARASRGPAIAAAAVVVLAIGGGLFWIWGRGEAKPPAPAASSTTAGPAAPAPANDRTVPAPPPVEPSVPSTAGNAPAPQPPPSATPAPAPTTPAPRAETADPLAAPLARITQLNREGNLAAALGELDRIEPSADSRVAAVARGVSQAAARSMDAAHATADNQKARELAPTQYQDGERAQRLADAALKRNDYVQSGRQALEAAAAYQRAAAAARSAAAAPPPTTVKPTPPPPTTAAATPAPANPSPTPAPTPPASARTESAAPPRTEAPPPPRTEAPAAATPAPATAAANRAADSAGILQALTRYKEAYRKMDVKALLEVFPNLGREPSQALQRQWRDCKSYDVTFGNIRPSFVEGDSTAATVTVQTTYTCTPKGKQAEQPQTVQDFFSLNKIGDVWVIESIGGKAAQRR